MFDGVISWPYLSSKPWTSLLLQLVDISWVVFWVKIIIQNAENFLPRHVLADFDFQKQNFKTTWEGWKYMNLRCLLLLLLLTHKSHSTKKNTNSVILYKNHRKIYTSLWQAPRDSCFFNTQGQEWVVHPFRIEKKYPVFVYLV